MKTIHLTINLIRAETAEERAEREHLAVILRCMTAAIVAVAVLALVLAWRGIALSRAVIRESQQVTSMLAPPVVATVPLSMSQSRQVTAADLYVIESSGRDLTNPSPLTDEEWATLLEVCENNRIAPSVALGLIQVESGFNPLAVSSGGCYGYCQLNPQYFPSGLSPEDNIRYGINYLGACILRHDNLEAGLTAYNAGYDTGARGYANRVLATAEEWEGRP